MVLKNITLFLMLPCVAMHVPEGLHEWAEHTITSKVTGGIAWRSDGLKLAVGLADEVLMFNETALEECGPRTHTPGLEALAWKPHDDIFVAGSSGGPATGLLQLHSSEDAKPFTIQGSTGVGIPVASYSPDGSLIAIGEGHGIGIIDMVDHRHSVTLPGHTGVVTCLSWSPDGGRLASGAGDCRVIIWNRLRNWAKPQEIFKASRVTSSVAWSLDGDKLAVACGSAGVKVLDGLSGQEVASLDDSFYHLAWHPRRNILACAGGRSGVWDLDSDAKKVRELRSRDNNSCYRFVAWHPQGHMLAVANPNDKTVRISIDYRSLFDDFLSGESSVQTTPEQRFLLRSLGAYKQEGQPIYWPDFERYFRQNSEDHPKIRLGSLPPLVKAALVRALDIRGGAREGQ